MALATSHSALVSPASALVSPNSDLVIADPDIVAAGAAFTPPADFGFTVAELQGEIARMWVTASGTERVFDLREGSETGDVVQDTPIMVPDGPVLNRLRVFSAGANIRFHATGPSLSTWAAANDGGTDEPDLAFHFYSSATNTVERRLVDRSGAGGGYLNFNNNSGALVAFFGALLVTGEKVLIVLADSS